MTMGPVAMRAADGDRAVVVAASGVDLETSRLPTRRNSPSIVFEFRARRRRSRLQGAVKITYRRRRANRSWPRPGKEQQDGCQQAPTAVEPRRARQLARAATKRDLSVCVSRFMSRTPKTKPGTSAQPTFNDRPATPKRSANVSTSVN